MKTTVTSNGSKWNGSEPDPIDALWPVLDSNSIDPRIYYSRRLGDQWHVIGNFIEISHVFNITTSDGDLIKRLREACAASLQRGRKIVRRSERLWSN